MRAAGAWRQRGKKRTPLRLIERFGSGASAAEHREAQSCDCCHKPAVFLQSLLKSCPNRRLQTRWTFMEDVSHST